MRIPFEFCIKDSYLSEAFNIELSNFKELSVRLEDEEILKESLHFVIRNRSRSIRLFSKTGALEIASYLDKHNQLNGFALQAILVLMEGLRIKQVDLEVSKAVYNNSSSLMSRRSRHWLSSIDVFKVLRTTSQKLDQAFKSIQKSNDPMELEQDFADFEQARYYSFSGLEKLSIELRLILKSNKRKEYCGRVRIVAPPLLKDLAILPYPKETDVKKAMNYVKNNRDSQKCQVEGVTREDGEEVELVAHHLYDQNNYRFVADELDNIITILSQKRSAMNFINGMAELDNLVP